MDKGPVVAVTVFVFFMAVILFILGMGANDGIVCRQMLDRSHNAADSATVYRLDRICTPHA